MNTQIQDLQPNLQPILDAVLELQQQGRVEINQAKFETFLQSAVNGDDLISYLAVATCFGDNQPGILLYLLTSSRIIKIEMDATRMQASPAYHTQVVGISRSLLSDTEAEYDAQVVVNFTQGSFGLKYTTDPTIDEFFNQVDQAVRRIKVKVS